VWQYSPVDEATFAEFFTPGVSVGRLLSGIKARLGITACQVAVEEMPA
jgi:hypothetical protein